MGTEFKVGEGNRVLAQISDAAAELLAEAYEMRQFGVELDIIMSREWARELVAEGFGAIATEDVDYGVGFVQVFRISDAGREWLEDAGRI